MPRVGIAILKAVHAVRLGRMRCVLGSSRRWRSASRGLREGAAQSSGGGGTAEGLRGVGDPTWDPGGREGGGGRELRCSSELCSISTELGCSEGTATTASSQRAEHPPQLPPLPPFPQGPICLEIDGIRGPFLSGRAGLRGPGLGWRGPREHSVGGGGWGGREAKPRGSFYPKELNLQPPFRRVLLLTALLRVQCPPHAAPPHPAAPRGHAGTRCCAGCWDAAPTKPAGTLCFARGLLASPHPTSPHIAPVPHELSPRARQREKGRGWAARGCADRCSVLQAIAQPRGPISQIVIANYPLIRGMKNA